MNKSFMCTIVSIICLLSGCSVFNLSIPEYIKKYTEDAAAEKVISFIPEVLFQRSDGIMIIKPGTKTEIRLILRNPKLYELDPILEEYRNDLNDWAPPSTSPTGISARYEAPNTVVVTIGGDNLFPYEGEIFRLRVTLKVLDETGRIFDPFVLPVLKCNDFPATPAILNVKPAGSGFTLLWTPEEPDRNNISDANRLTISCGASSETYTRTYQEGTGWNSWNGPDNSAIADIYQMTVLQNLQTYIGSPYQLTVTLTNEDGMPVQASFTYDGSSEIYYVTDNGIGDGSSAGSPCTFDNAFVSVRDNSFIDHATIVVVNDNVDNILELGSYTIPSGKTIVLTSDGNSNTLKLNADGIRMFDIPTGASLYLTGGTSELILEGRLTNTTSLIQVAGGNLEMGNGVLITGNKNDAYAGTGGGVIVNNGTFTMNGGTIAGCEAAAYGGGIAMMGAEPKFIMNNGKIGTAASPNKANEGGGIRVNFGTFTMNGGSIEGNEANSLGGGVNLNGNGAVFIMNGGNIGRVSAPNKAPSGAAVYARSTNSFTMNDGSIEGNIATMFGGGVYIQGDSAKFLMNGGIINYNNAAINGGAVCVYTPASFTQGPQAVIENNSTEEVWYN
ncbi:hypothetical protein [Breznakiella homolactica]|uniref:Uncharacterized protein n=1 Tax=Breznakiella homolactica TaxID=2798577 RepID=A0A7T7XRB3_9SPIR|nr:hypothetical protein [Breznakiella homolactica]QQO11002.1 hypothetical protein JFL75_08815 [Breznakiella homolactica]